MGGVLKKTVSTPLVPAGEKANNKLPLWTAGADLFDSWSS